MDEVVLRALEKDPEKRYHSAQEIRADVEAIIAPPAVAVEVRQQGATERVPTRRAACYFSTPEQMRHCFRTPQPRIFQCKGDLWLESETLTFISPWQTRVVIPLRAIRNLSLGQFQMWSTHWLMKNERICFLSVTFGNGHPPRTVHLTPVGPISSSAARITARGTEWLEAVRKAVAKVTGADPLASRPAEVTVWGKRCWNQRAGPLLILAPLAAWLVGVMNIRSPFGPAPAAPWLGAFLVSLLLFLALGWFFIGLLKANQALQQGDLDAVTSDEPPTEEEESSGERMSEPAIGPGQKRTRPFRWTLIAWAFIAVGVIALIDTLASLYSRPISQTLYPGIAQLFVGIALLTSSRRWRLVALVMLSLGLVAGVFICLMTILSPEHGSVSLPGLGHSVSVAEAPRLAATAVVFLAFYLGCPLYLLMCAKGKALFGIGRANSSIA